jgi:RimJ/RimL family protein N-acetyltransferase
MNLRTSRLFLRPLGISDAPALFEARSDPEVMRYWDWPAQKSVGEVEGIIADHFPEVADGNVLWWAVALSPGGLPSASAICRKSTIATAWRKWASCLPVANGAKAMRARRWKQ